MPKRGERRWHEQALACPEVERWYNNLKRRNATTADIYLRRLARTLHEAKAIEPQELLALEQEDLEDVVTDCIEHELARGLLGSTVVGFLKAARSFLDWHGREIKRKNHIPNADDYPNAENSAIPTQEQLRGVLKVCNARTAAAMLLVAHGGLRPQIIGNIDATDGLRLGDLPDLRITDSSVDFEATPPLVQVRKSLSKTNKPFFTFLTQEAAEHVLAYLRWRIKEGEVLTPESPLITPYGGEPRFSLRNNIGDAIRRAMRSAGVAGPPYIWRSYFANRCLMAESKGLLSSYRRFFMGHAGDIQMRYALRKQLSPDVIDRMRSAYATASEFLEATPMASPDVAPQVIGMLLKVSGYTDEQVAELDVGKKSHEELAQLIRDKLGGAQPAASLVTSSTPRQRIVSLDGLEAAMAEGWSFRTTLPDGRAIVEA